MADPTLIKGTGAAGGSGYSTFSTSTTTTLTLYNAKVETVRKSGNMLPYPLPLANSNSQLVFDLLGVTREISLSGIFIASSDPLTVNKFCSDLNALIYGNQGNTGGGQVGYTFASQSLGSNITVYVNNVSWSYAAGSPNIIEYSLDLMEVGSGSG